MRLREAAARDGSHFKYQKIKEKLIHASLSHASATSRHHRVEFLHLPFSTVNVEKKDTTEETVHKTAARREMPEMRRYYGDQSKLLLLALVRFFAASGGEEGSTARNRPQVRHPDEPEPSLVFTADFRRVKIWQLSSTFLRLT